MHRNDLYRTFLCCLLVGTLQAQQALYLFSEKPSLFPSIEKDLLTENLDSVWIKCDAIIEQSSDVRTRGMAYFHKGQADDLVGGEAYQEPSYSRAIELFQESDYQEGLAMAYGKVADRYFFDRYLLTADSIYNYSIRYAREVNLPQVLLNNYQKKANISMAMGNTEGAIAYLKQALFFAQAEQRPDRINDILNDLSTTFHAQGQLDSAIFYYQKIMTFKEQLGDREGIMSDLSALGKLYRERGNYDQAQEVLMEALRIAESEEDDFSKITLFTEIGDVYYAQGIWANAEQYYQKALDLAVTKKRRFAQADCLKKIADLSLQKGEKETAIQRYEAALSIYESMRNKTKAAEILIQLCQLLESDQNVADARLLLTKALESKQYAQDVRSTLSIKKALANIEIQYGDQKKGVELAEELLAAYQSQKDILGMTESYQLLAEAHARIGNYKNAYRYEKQFQSLKDSLANVELATAIKQFDLQFNTEKKDKEIAQQNEQLKAQQVEILEKNNQLLLSFGGLGLLALIGGFLTYAYRKSKQVARQQIEVLEKEKETQRLKALIEGEEKERKRFARELHDGLGAVLATVKMHISGIKREAPDTQHLPAYQKADLLIDQACRTVREISHNLMPYVLEQQGLFYAIEDMCQQLSNHHEIQVDFISFGAEDRLSEILKITLFRITQELLKNCLNHAKAKEILVQLTIEETGVMLIVEDDGIGFDPRAEKGGIGLHNIRSRINYLNGQLEVDSRIGEGSSFTIQIPIENKPTVL